MGYQVDTGTPQEDGRLGAGRKIESGGSSLLAVGGVEEEALLTALLTGFPRRLTWAGWPCEGPQEQEEEVASSTYGWR